MALLESRPKAPPSVSDHFGVLLPTLEEVLYEEDSDRDILIEAELSRKVLAAIGDRFFVIREGVLMTPRKRLIVVEEQIHRADDVAQVWFVGYCDPWVVRDRGMGVELERVTSGAPVHPDDLKKTIINFSKASEVND